MNNKLFPALNIPKQLRSYYLLKRIASLTARDGTRSPFVADMMVAVAALVSLILNIHLNSGPQMKKLMILLVFICIALWYIRIVLFIMRYQKSTGSVSRLILQDEEERNVQEWYLAGRHSLIIGRRSAVNHVDIDLSRAENAFLINPEQAILNYCNNSWYIEDIGPSSRSCLKKISGTDKVVLEREKHYKLDQGDTLYIANTKIVLR